MGDRETVVTETSTVIDYSASGYVDAGSNVYGGEAIGNTNYAMPTSVDGNAYVQETHVDASYGTKSVEMGGTGENVAATGAPAVNGNIASEAAGVGFVENGNTVENVGGTAAEPHLADGSVMSSEEERLWSILKANSLDFDAWTALIDETEKVSADKILKIRKVYDAFLAEFPLCYGYWKKYADHEARIGSMDKVVEVYERAIVAVTYSVDIWLHYCTFLISTYGDPENVRSLFERALAYVGTDYLSFPLWDKYIEYEEMQANWVNVASIYTRILEIPNRRLDDYFNRFKIFAASRPLSELRTAEEAAALAPPLSKDGSESKEGETHPNESEEASKPVGTGLSAAEELEKYVAIREEIYKKAKEFDSKIADFENAIRRPYFHVRPLNIIELENWHNYLDFMEREDLNKVVKLYERCAIACANYPEYWIRYVLCMEVFGSLDRANNALTRATQVFVKRQPEIHLFAARFKEQNGDIAGARASYQLLHTEVAPALLEAITKHANMEHRLGNLKDAFSLYEQAIAIEKGKEHSQVLPMLYAQYSRFVNLVSGNVEKAREILVQGLENVQLSKPLLEALVHLESIQSQPKRIDYLDSLVDKFIGPNSDSAGSFSEREELSSIFLEFMSLFGDVPSIKKAEDRHAKLFLPHRSKSESKKRGAEDFLASDKTKIAKSYSDASSPAQSLMGAYPSAQNQWPAGYGAQPQAWPPATQGQVQQWVAPGYSQQAAYGAYSGAYGSTYSTPPAPTSVAQTTAYGAYPPTYPVQQAAFPQHSYAQPTATAAAALPTAPQPASVPQPYYGSYY